MRLNQKVALITSSSLGICADTAKQLAKEGAKVMICGRNATQGLATVKQIRNEGGRASFVLADIAIAADVKAAIDETIATYGRLDILFNEASGLHPRDSLFLEVTETVWDRVVESTLKGTFLCCQYALPFLQQARQQASSSGTIINLIQATPNPQIYSVATICQGGIVAMTHAMTQQFEASSVTANLIWASQPADSTLTPLPNPPPNPMPNPMAAPPTTPATGQVPGEDAPSEDDPEAEGAEPNSEPLVSEPLVSMPLSPMPAAAANLMGQPMLYGPPACDRPFTDLAEAVMYLACHGDTLHGTALIVSATTPSS
ncbi:MAG: SDR family NAD(P)-dependent oxidoreductase [Cyanobacteria bacterium P01_A01_bin.116]